MGDKDDQPDVIYDKTVGMSGGVNKNGTVIGKNNGEVKTHNAPEKETNTNIRRCTNVTKTGDVDGGTVRIGGGGGGSGGTPSSPKTARLNTVQPERKEQIPTKSTYTAGMTGGYNDGGTVIGENNAPVSRHNAPGKISNTTIEDSTNVTAVNDVTGDTVEIGGGGAGSNVGGRGEQNQQVKKDVKEFSVEEIQDLLREEKFDEEIIGNFKKKGISGKFFLKLKGPMLEELGFKSAIDKMKIETLIDEHSNQSQGQS